MPPLPSLLGVLILRPPKGRVVRRDTRIDSSLRLWWPLNGAGDTRPGQGEKGGQGEAFSLPLPSPKGKGKGKGKGGPKGRTGGKFDPEDPRRWVPALNLAEMGGRRGGKGKGKFDDIEPWIAEPFDDVFGH